MHLVTIISSRSGAAAPITNSINSAEFQVISRQSIDTPASELNARGNSEHEAGKTKKSEQGAAAAVGEDRAENHEPANERNSEAGGTAHVNVVSRTKEEEASDGSDSESEVESDSDDGGIRIASLVVGYKTDSLSMADRQHNEILQVAYDQAQQERGVSNENLIHFKMRARALREGLDDQLVLQEMQERHKPLSERKTSVLVTDEEKENEKSASRETNQLPGRKKISKRGFSIEERNNIKQATFLALKDSGASPSLCHSDLVRDLGLTRMAREETLNMQGAFDSTKGGSEYVVMVIIVQGYREEFRVQGSEEWTRTSGGASPPPGAETRTVLEERKFLMHAEVCDTIFVHILLGQNVNVANNIIALCDQNRSTFFRDEDLIFVPHHQKPKKPKRKSLQVSCIQMAEDGEDKRIQVAHINMVEVPEADRIEWVAKWRRVEAEREAFDGTDKDHLGQQIQKIDSLCSREEGPDEISSNKVLNSMQRVRIMLAMLGLDQVYHWLPRRLERSFLELLDRTGEGKFQRAFNILGEIDRYIVKEQSMAVWGHMQKVNRGARQISEETIVEWYQWMLDNICLHSSIGHQASGELFRKITYQSIHNMDKFISIEKKNRLQDFHKVSWYPEIRDELGDHCRCCGKQGHPTVHSELKTSGDTMISTLKYCPDVWSEKSRGVWIKDWCELDDQGREWALRDIASADRRKFEKQYAAELGTNKERMERTEERRKLLTEVMTVIHSEYQQLKAEGPKFHHPKELLESLRRLTIQRLEGFQLKRAQVTIAAKKSQTSPKLKFQDLWKIDPRELSSELVRRAALDDPQGLLKQIKEYKQADLAPLLRHLVKHYKLKGFEKEVESLIRVMQDEGWQ